MTTNFFITKAAEEPNAKSAENRQVVVDRYNTRFGELLAELEELWTECGDSGDLLNERSIRYDKSNWRRAFNQMRTGVNRIIASELQCDNCCTETKKQERIKKLVRSRSKFTFPCENGWHTSIFEWKCKFGPFELKMIDFHTKMSLGFRPFSVKLDHFQNMYQNWYFIFRAWKLTNGLTTLGSNTAKKSTVNMNTATKRIKLQNRNFRKNLMVPNGWQTMVFRPRANRKILI